MIAQQGWQKLPLISSAVITRLQTRMHEIVAEARKSSAAASSFSSEKQEQRLEDNVFDRSAEDVTVFDRSAEGVEVFYEEGSDEQLVNKVGHALDALDPVFREFCHSDYVREVAHEVLGYERPLICQSMYIFKSAKGGSAVLPHKDNAYIRTTPYSTRALWIPIHRATTENGCLTALEGSHRNGPTRFFLRQLDGKMAFIGKELKEEGEWINLEAEAGEPLVFDGNLTHSSSANTSGEPREAFVIHFIEGTPEYKWADDNWLQRPNLGFQKV